VTDPASLGAVDEMLIPALREELHWMGQTLLSIAHQRALLAGLEAEVVIRVGKVEAEIGRYLHESGANLLLLGAPRGTTANVFGDDAIEKFADSLQKATNLPVEIIRPENLYLRLWNSSAIFFKQLWELAQERKPSCLVR
jgi:hypothetical protein